MSSSTNPVILVVDPCGLDLTATAAVLHDKGFDVHCAQDRCAALKAALQLPLDLVICDISIDCESDEKLVDRIRRMPDRNEVSIMFSSANQIPDIIRRTDSWGSCYHLRKPFDPEVMMALVDKALWRPLRSDAHIHRPHIQLNPLNSIQADSILS